MSILLSTRQKNWLSTPKENSRLPLQKVKQVSFQLNNSTEDNSQVTMAKGRNYLDNRDSSSSDNKKKKVEKSSGIRPFLFTPEEWPNDAAT